MKRKVDAHGNLIEVSREKMTCSITLDLSFVEVPNDEMTMSMTTVALPYCDDE